MSERHEEGLEELAGDERGSYQTEYTIVLVVVAVVAGLAIGGLSLPLIEYYRSVQSAIVSPTP